MADNLESISSQVKSEPRNDGKHRPPHFKTVKITLITLIVVNIVAKFFILFREVLILNNTKHDNVLLTITTIFAIGFNLIALHGVRRCWLWLVVVYSLCSMSMVILSLMVTSLGVFTFITNIFRAFFAIWFAILIEQSNASIGHQPVKSNQVTLIAKKTLVVTEV